MAADKYLTILDVDPKEKVEDLIFADMIIAMKNLGHHYFKYNYEAAPFNLVYNRIAFPDVSFSDYLSNERIMDHVKKAFDTFSKTTLVGEGRLADLNIPKVIERTPFYDDVKLYYESLFLISKYTTLVDKKIDMKEFEGLYRFSNYIDIDNL